MYKSLSILSTLMLVGACGSGDGESKPSDGGTNSRDGALGAISCEKMDILFVIDKSGTMQEEQENLIANFPQFAGLIDNYMTSAGNTLDYRIAVTTAGRDVNFQQTGPMGNMNRTEEGDNGEFRLGCGLDRAWIEKSDPQVTGLFSCRAAVGTDDSTLEMPLLAAKLALGERLQDTNAGFLREDALLAIVFITDEDDCSREEDGFNVDVLAPTCFDSSDVGIAPLDETIGFLDTLKGDRGRWATAVIAGPGPGKCTSDFGDAEEAVRMKDFVTKSGTNAVFSSICSGDLTDALGDALGTFSAACESFPEID